MRIDDVSKGFPGIKRIKIKSDMWDPHVRGKAHGGLSPPSLWIWAGLDCHVGAHVAADTAPQGMTRAHGAEVAGDVARHVGPDGGEGLDAPTTANGGSPARVSATHA